MIDLSVFGYTILVDFILIAIFTFAIKAIVKHLWNKEIPFWAIHVLMFLPLVLLQIGYGLLVIQRALPH
jgi:hypothetical protein